MNVSLWVMYSGDHSLDKLWFYVTTSFAFDVAHAVGSAAFCLAFGPALVRALRRYRTRFEVTWRPAPVTAGLVVALLALSVAAPQRAQADVPAAAVRYLERAQNSDGGFGPAPGAGSTQMHTGWAALGLAAAGRNPRDVERGGRSVVDYMTANVGKLRGDLGERSRTILALRAAGVSPRRLGGRDLLGELVRAQESDGSFAGLVNTTAFAVLALRAAGRPARDSRGASRSGVHRRPGERRRRLQLRRQGRPVGRRRHRRGAPGAGCRRAAALARWCDAPQTGSSARRTPTAASRCRPGASNAQSTAWAVQGLIAAGRDPARVRRGGSRTPLAYLRSLMGSSGAIRYSRTSTQTPVWVTAQALTALARKALPVAPAQRKRRSHATAAPAPTPTPEPAEEPEAPAPTAQPATLAAAPAASQPAMTPVAIVRARAAGPDRRARPPRGLDRRRDRANVVAARLSGDCPSLCAKRSKPGRVWRHLGAGLYRLPPS